MTRSTSTSRLYGQAVSATAVTGFERPTKGWRQNHGESCKRKTKGGMYTVSTNSQSQRMMSEEVNYVPTDK